MDGPAAYEIRVQGKLSPRWTEWFDGMEFSYEPDGSTILSGTLPDQAALFGVLGRIRDLGLILLSARQLT